MDLKQPRYCLASHLRMATRSLNQLHDEIFKPTGLHGTQFTLLAMLDGFGSISITDLAAFAAIDRTTLTRNLRLLEQKGWVTSQPGEDRRVRLMTLTPEGQAKLADALPIWQAAQQDLIDQLGEAGAYQLLAVAGAVISATDALHNESIASQSQ